MNVISYSNARAQLNDVMDSAIHDKQEIVVTRKNVESIVIASLEEWNSISETLHLLSS